MKNKLFISTVLLSFILFVACKKDSSTSAYPVAGLYEGTYTYLAQPPLYFSFTIYADGTMSYKSRGSNNYIFYAIGTWNLNGNAFSYTVQTTNTPNVATQPVQTGTATYSNSGTLTNGVNTDMSTGLSGTFSLKRVN